MPVVIKMVITYDIEKINAILEDFYKATDININLLRSDFSYVGGRVHRENNYYCCAVQASALGSKGCKCSDEIILQKCRKTKQIQMHKCHAGLWDAAVPIIYNDVIIGYVIFGEMKDEADFSANREYIASLGLDPSVMEKYYKDIVPFDRNKIKSIAKVASMLASYILLENMLKPDLDENVEKAVMFISENLSEDLSIESISQKIHVSKNVLYKSFRTNFDCTVGEYITARRVERSCELLKTTDLSIDEISQRTGFSSASYFSKVFKKAKGISPIRYRKHH